MNKVYKFNEEWLDILLKDKNNIESYKLSGNEIRMLLTYIEVLQNRIDKAIEYCENDDNFQIIDLYSQDIVDKIQEELLNILKGDDEN